MIIQCNVLCKKAEEIEQEEYYRELGVEVPEPDDYWMPRYLDLSKAFSLFAYDEQSDEMGSGNLCIDLDNSGMVVVTNIPFTVFEPYMSKKNSELLVVFNGEDLLFTV